MNEKMKSYMPLIIILAVFLCVLVGIVVITKTYQSVQADKNEHIEHMKKFVQKNFNMNTLDSYTYFVNEKSYEIATGTIDHEKFIIFNPILNDKKEEAKVFELNALKDVDKIIGDWEHNCSDCKLKKSGFAMIDEVPVYEITYIDAQKRYVLEYINLKDGEIYETLTLQN